MKNLLPGKIELAILLSLVVVSTIIVAISPKIDLGLAGMTVPLFFFASLLGLRRNWRLADMGKAAE